VTPLQSDPVRNISDPPFTSVSSSLSFYFYLFAAAEARGASREALLSLTRTKEPHVKEYLLIKDGVWRPFN